MSIVMEEEIKRWTPRRKAALVLEIIQGKTTVSEASRQFDLPSSEIESWVEDGKHGMENALQAKPEDVREQYERQLTIRAAAEGSPGSLRRGDVGAACPKKIGVPVGQGRDLMVTIQQGLWEDGFEVSMVKLCRWFGGARRSVYYRPSKASPKVRAELAAPIKAMIEEDPSFGYRTVAGLLGMNKNTVQRIFQLKGWQVRKRAVGFRPRIEALPSVATAPDQRWATDLCRVWGGRDGWLTLALVIDCHTRQLLGWQLSRSGKATTAAAALEQALITRFGTLGRVRTPFLSRSDNGLVFTSRAYTRLVRSYGLKQEFITPHCPQQNGMVERVIRTLKEQCVHQHRFETQQHASRVIGDWIQFYNHRRPHQALGMKTPAEAYALAA